MSTASIDVKQNEINWLLALWWKHIFPEEWFGYFSFYYHRIPSTTFHIIHPITQTTHYRWNNQNTLSVNQISISFEIFQFKFVNFLKFIYVVGNKHQNVKCININSFKLLQWYLSRSSHSEHLWKYHFWTIETTWINKEFLLE